MNMAIDEALLEYCQTPVLRIYGWKPSAVSIGYNQDIKKEINAEYCRKNNIAIVRRLTGGKAVFHDKEITYSFIIPEKNKLVPLKINESYKKIANALVIALEKLGVKAEIKKAPERISTPICFNSSNWYELLVNGRKISGSAQRRISGKILQHGPILLDFDYNKNNSIFNSNNPIDNVENLKKRITSLNYELKNINKNNNVGYKKIAEAVKYGFKENFGLSLKEDSLTIEEKNLAESLKKGKYLTSEWTYKASKTI
jgi:lipoate-protein ligase A